MGSSAERQLQEQFLSPPAETPEEAAISAKFREEILAERVQWLGIAFADALPEQFSPPDELVAGLLTQEGGSMLYGASNSGKTFLALDIACAVARGVPWLGTHQTEAGLVVYLAAESPSSVRSRLQAYQQHHALRVPNLAIVQRPIDLFGGDVDMNELINAVLDIEKARGQKARLIVGDTLARVSAGANENAGQDMGQVIRRFDRIRSECKAHFMLVHHSGKAATAGARGWSGIRAAMDTEIEVTETASGRCAEITKQRDLNTKGERVGFRLEQVALGSTKWGAPATSCVVVPAAPPKAQAAKRVGKIELAILDKLRAVPDGLSKSDVVAALRGHLDKSGIYRELKRLAETGAVLEWGGKFSLTRGGGEGSAD